MVHQIVSWYQQHSPKEDACQGACSCSLLSFLLLPQDPLQPLQSLLIHTQLSLLSFESMTWRWPQFFRGRSTELIMTCNTSALLFAISRCVLTRPTVGTLGLFHFWEAMRNPFLHQVLWLTLGYLLQLLPRHLLLLKIPTFKKIDPFSIDDKNGERDFVELSGSLLFSCLYLCIFYVNM